MGNVNEIIKKASEDYNNWFNKNKKLIESLGLSWNNASHFRKQIDEVQVDIERFNKTIKKWVVFLFIILICLSVLNYWVKKDCIKLFYFKAYYLGLVGSFFVSYGYLLQIKHLLPPRKNRQFVLPNPPREFNYFPDYAYRLNEFLADYINSQFENNWPQIKIEFRKQISLFWGFVIIVVSYLIQLIMQFF